GDNLGADLICTYRNDSTVLQFDRVRVYREISNKTDGITKLDVYSLDQNSLYVNGYNEALLRPTLLPTTTPTAPPNLERFTVNFTVTNLKYKPELGAPSSKEFNSTASTL
uniref:SEA domain-containing protein n=1 Tax=Sphenodon punctatus TaxID=8508 RepID=A0A8D0H7G9_SPHPU